MKYLIIRFDGVSKNPIFCGASVDPESYDAVVDKAETIGMNFRDQEIFIFKQMGTVVVPRGQT